MAARRRAQEGDYNRRRRLILDKGIELAYCQKDTAFGECLLKWNVREEQHLERRQHQLERQQDIAVGHKEQEKRQFVVLRDQATREPTLLLSRQPTAEQYPDFVDFNQPRYMRPLETRQSKTPDFKTFSVFQAVKKRKRNPWEEAVKESVQFRPTLCPCPRLNRTDTEDLTSSWMKINELQSKSLGLVADNRSAPGRMIRPGSNPLGLPSRLNSRLNHRAVDLLGDIPSSSVSDTSSVSEPDEQVFITQLPKTHESLFDEKDDKKKKEKQAERKQQVDDALASLYDLLGQRRVVGRPHLRAVNSRPHYTYAGRDPSSRPTTVSTMASSSCAETQPAAASGVFDVEEIRTTCRTAESIRILLDAKRTVRRRNSCRHNEPQEARET